MNPCVKGVHTKPSDPARRHPTRCRSTGRHPGERRDPLLASAQRNEWIPAFAGMTRVRERCACGARGFTLLELLVVILIIGLLTGIVAPRFMGQVSRSEVTTAKAQLDALDKAIQSYRIDTGRFPNTAQGLRALVTQPGDEPRWRGPYLQGDVPVDPWGSTYQYRAPGANGRDFELLSYGKDRVPGGSGDDADLIR
jgi:general secretion pathway protein G